MKKISILGSTGSIGKNALQVIDQLKDKYEVLVLTANKNHQLLIEQIKKYKPKYAVVGTEEGYRELKKEFGNKVELFCGTEGLKEIGKLDETDILLTAVMGSVGLEATVEAIKKGKRIALANKETMVAAGGLINKLLQKSKSEIIPVDSEHSAIFQALKSGNEKEIEKLIITASGGPFRKMNQKELENVTLEQALKHPNWSMGSKITIDSATMVNKGLEVIEAHYLFNMNYDKIDVVVHPESIVHSLVEFRDKSIIAQMGNPDMKLPIQYAFTYPERLENNLTKSLDFREISKLTFEMPKKKLFKGLEFAYDSGKIGKSMPIVFNAANEIAVEKFLNREIKFLDIYKIIEKTMNNHKLVAIDNINAVLEVDRETREIARRILK